MDYALKSGKPYPGTDVPIDQNLLVNIINMKLKKINKGTTNNRKDISKLHNTRTLVRNTLIAEKLNITGEHCQLVEELYASTRGDTTPHACLKFSFDCVRVSVSSLFRPDRAPFCSSFQTVFKDDDGVFKSEHSEKVMI